jgi:hypothetical protein
MLSKKLLEGHHIMVDIETLDNKPGAIITEIGAVGFSIKENKLDPIANFNRKLNVRESLKDGFTMGLDTLAWWIGKDAKKLKEEYLESLHISNVNNLQLSEFRAFLNMHPMESTYLWAKSPSFDLRLLKSYYDKYQPDQPLPWEFRNEMCYRTLTSLFDSEIYVPKPIHNGYEDAKIQAVHTLTLTTILKNTQSPFFS